MKNQTIVIFNAIKRLAYRTVVDVEGWRKIIVAGKLFRHYGVDENTLELSYQKVYHPNHSTKETYRRCFFRMS